LLGYNEQGSFPAAGMPPLPSLITKEKHMKKLIALVCLGFAFAVSSPAFAGDQQDKMKGCNKEAKGMVMSARNS
jgi:hypothetical protein